MVSTQSQTEPVFFDQYLISAYRYLEPEILVRFAIFGVRKGPRSYTKNFRSEAYGLNETHFLGPKLLGHNGPGSSVPEPELFVRFGIFVFLLHYRTCGQSVRLMG